MAESDSDTNELTIETVLRHYKARKIPAGSGWRPMRCPFHKDSRASASVNHSLNAFKCHGCPVSGDAVAVVKKVEKLKTRREAIERARQIFGQSFEDVSPSVQRRTARRPRGNKRWKEILD